MWGRPGAGRDTGARDSRAAHQAGNACGSANGRAILDRERLAADWETGARDSRAAHQAGNACGSAIGRAILFK